METVKLKAAGLSALIIFSGIISLDLLMALPPRECVIRSSGLVSTVLARQLHTEGRYVKDDLGRIVFLRGVFKAEFTDTCSGWFPRNGFAMSDGYGSFGGDGQGTGVRQMCQKLRDVWGTNFVGVYIWADWWINNRNVTLSQYVPTTDIHYRDAIRKFIEIAGQYGIYVLVSVYACNPIEGRKDPMVPYPPMHDGSTFPNKEAYIDFYVNSLAYELRNYPNVVFCPFDEPKVLTDAEIAEWNGVVQTIIDEIRGMGCTNLFLYHWGYCGGMYWLYDWTGAGVGQPGLPFNGTNIVYSQTVYRAAGTFPQNEYLYDDVKAVLCGPLPYRYEGRDFPYGWGYRHVAEDLNLPLINYVGARRGETDDQEYECFKNVLRVWNELEQGYAAYQWHRSDFVWAIQQDTTVIQPPNRVGQALIDAIVAGSP